MMNSFNSIFHRSIRIFDNISSTSLVRHEIDFPQILSFVQYSSRIFQMLDRNDSVQLDISRRLWFLRSTVLFTLLPFDNPKLKLDTQLNDLKIASNGVPEIRVLIESLNRCISEILNHSINPKREWLCRHISDTADSSLNETGLLTALSAGRTPGWPLESHSDLFDLLGSIKQVSSRKTLKLANFARIILPCGCNNVSISLLTDLIYSGISSKFDVLLYPGERFYLPKRLILPDDELFFNRIQQTEIEHSISIVNDHESSIEDKWINEAFWHGLHGADRSESHGLIPARYILFCDGAGVFIPEDGRVIALPQDGVVSSDSDLCQLEVADVLDGDLLVLRSGNSGYLLDNVSNRITGRLENDSLLETATSWKEPLDALLVTHSSQEVAQELSARGVPTKAVSINHWVGPEVLGPGDEKAFRELIHLLADKGKISKSDEELTDYASQCWSALQSIRGLHQKAGNLIRQDLFKALFKRFGNQPSSKLISDRETIHIDGDTNAELLIMRVNSVDSSVAYVPPSRLGKIDDLKGNKWLG